MLQAVFALVAYLAFIVALVALSVQDYKTKRIPNAALLALVGIWIAWQGLSLAYEAVTGEPRLEVVPPAMECVATAVGVLVLGLVSSVGFEKATGRFSMGGGDIKLFSVCALYLGFYRELTMAAIACIVGICWFAAAKLIAKRKDSRFPFAPSIAVASVIALLT